MATTVLSPTAILGYGFPEESFERGVARKPDLIAVDAGSTDPGPFYLGQGVSFTDRAAVKRDLGFMLQAGRELGIPVTVGSAGGSGATAHLEWTLDIVREIAGERGLSFTMAVIDTEVSHDWLSDRLQAGKVSPLGAVPELTPEALEATTSIVAQVGMEPFQVALAEGADVVVCGRSYDPAVFACLPVLRGDDKALSLHMGKILECAAIAALPGSGSDCMLGTIAGDTFVVEPLSTSRVCTVTSVAAHTLYEKSDPYILPGPGGALDLTRTSFHQLDARRVSVAGSAYRATPRTHIKLEGARRVGFRTVSIAGARDPVFIGSLDAVLAGVKERTIDNFPTLAYGDDYHLRFVVYGRDGVMGPLEPNRGVPSHEVGIVIDSVGRTQELADTICSFARSTLLHFGYAGRKCTAGNLALLYSPSDLHAGAVYEFSVHHLVEVDSPLETARIRYERVNQG